MIRKFDAVVDTDCPDRRTSEMALRQNSSGYLRGMT